jgi:hypothetical protein
MKIKTSELIEAALDWAVAICEHNVGWEPEGEDRDYYSTDWLQGGPIIEREKITPEWTGENWMAYIKHDDEFFGPTPLIAAMRCYVASKLGDEVEVPEELK